MDRVVDFTGTSFYGTGLRGGGGLNFKLAEL